jgi:hypothetical protein
MTLRRLLPALLVATSCAPPSTLPPAGAAGLPVVRSALDAGQADAVFERAARVLRRRGYELVTCDLDRGVLRTERTELDAPCRVTTCLARQFVTVKLGWRSVRLAVVREVWDSAYRSWIPAEDPAALEAVGREEGALLRDLLAADLEGARASAVGVAGGVCRLAEPCGQGQCSTMVHLIAR